MWPELWPRLTRLDQNERVHRKLAAFNMNSQLEAIRQQRLHHQAHLVFSRTPIRASLDREFVRLCPLWQLSG